MASRTICGFWVVAALSRYTSGLSCTRWLSTGKLSREVCDCQTVSVAVGMKFLQQGPLQLFPQRRDFDAVDDIAREGVDEQVASFGEAYAPRLQIKDSLRIQLADGRAVSAADVVGMNL